jgi:methylphosphotriester-DNA--protein-cysteine methyltransferase
MIDRTVFPLRRRKHARPRELLVAALDLFIERGFAATRTEEIAARAGVSKGTLYLTGRGDADLSPNTGAALHTLRAARAPAAGGRGPYEVVPRAASHPGSGAFDAATSVRAALHRPGRVGGYALLLARPGIST